MTTTVSPFTIAIQLSFLLFFFYSWHYYRCPPCNLSLDAKPWVSPVQVSYEQRVMWDRNPSFYMDSTQGSLLRKRGVIKLITQTRVLWRVREATISNCTGERAQSGIFLSTLQFMVTKFIKYVRQAGTVNWVYFHWLVFPTTLYLPWVSLFQCGMRVSPPSISLILLLLHVCVQVSVPPWSLPWFI